MSANSHINLCPSVQGSGSFATKNTTRSANDSNGFDKPKLSNKIFKAIHVDSNSTRRLCRRGFNNFRGRINRPFFVLVNNFNTQNTSTGDRNTEVSLLNNLNCGDCSSSKLHNCFYIFKKTVAFS